MNTTNLTLLGHAARGSSDSWVRLERLYRPFMAGWFVRKGIRPEDADDLSQDVLTVLVKELPTFQHNGMHGAFRTWLRNICLNRYHGYVRKRDLRGAPMGGTEFQQQMNEVAGAEEIQDWEREHDHYILARLLEQLVGEFEPNTVSAFRRLTLDRTPAQTIAAELGMSTAAIYMGKIARPQAAPRTSSRFGWRGYARLTMGTSCQTILRTNYFLVYLAGRTSKDESQLVEQHIVACDECTNQLGQISAREKHV